MLQELLGKYNKPVPRYTSYPTVPNWKEEIGAEAWGKALAISYAGSAAEGISLYVHLPFCESLCSYCGCNKKITKNHGVEDPYITAVLKEWSLYRNLLPEPPTIRELHLGGGTPTFFSPDNLRRLMEGIFEGAVRHPVPEFSFEGHPNNTTREHLHCLRELGFSRVSYGVQDNDPVVQRAITRIQPFEHVMRVTEEARQEGYESVNFDLIYGLPFQTQESIARTISETLTLRPDRVAFYSYAHVPWSSRGQRLYDEKDLPGPDEKIAMYLRGRELFLEAGYTDIGMDHFALPSDSLCQAWSAGSLHRNFMGYTTSSAKMMVGLGVSAISDTGEGYAQNEKALHAYYAAIGRNEIPVVKGLFLTAEDRAFRRYILDVICQGATRFGKEHLSLLQEYSFPALAELGADGLVLHRGDRLEVTQLGRLFLRNICSAFDLHLLRQGEGVHRFSKAI